MILRTTESAPASEPVTVDQLKAAARIDGSEFDLLIPLNITAARVVAEHQSGRMLAARTFTVELDGWPDSAIPITPAASVVVQYSDGAAWQTLNASVYEFVPEANGLRIELAEGQDWPDLPELAGSRVKVAVTTASENLPTARQFIIAQASYWTQSPNAASERKSEPSPFLSHLLDAIKVYA